VWGGAIFKKKKNTRGREALLEAKRNERLRQSARGENFYRPSPAKIDEGGFLKSPEKVGEMKTREPAWGDVCPENKSLGAFPESQEERKPLPNKVKAHSNKHAVSPIEGKSWIKQVGTKKKNCASDEQKEKRALRAAATLKGGKKGTGKIGRNRSLLRQEEKGGGTDAQGKLRFWEEGVVREKITTTLDEGIARRPRFTITKSNKGGRQ